MKKRDPLTVGLALGGGGVRGLAHLGVIKELEKDIPIQMIAGTSMGAVVGGMYALDPNIAVIEKKLFIALASKPMRDMEQFMSGQSGGNEKKVIMENLLSFVKKVYLFNLRVIKRWLFDGSELMPLFNYLGFDADFKATRLPFCVVSADLHTGQEVVLRDGNMKGAILASIALPGIFPPVRRGRHVLVDGGIVSSVPVGPCRELGASLVIGVGVEARVDHHKKLDNGLDIMFQADAIRQAALSESNLQFADIVIRPDVGHIGWAEFSRARECVQAGARAAQRMKPEILKLIHSRKRKSFWRRLFCK